MTTNTYVALDTQTLVSATNAVTFTSIPATYTDLVLVINTTNSESTSQPYIQFNSDTSGASTNYSTTSFRGTGSATASSRHTNQNGWYPVPGPGVGTNGNFEPWSITISNYASTNTYKNGLSRFVNASSITSANAHLWRSQSAISSITIKMESGNFNIGSVFNLYGIKAFSDEITPKATGGYIYSDSSYYYHAFPFSSTFTPSQSLTADILVVAGGGGGGYFEGGGGAGGLLTFSAQSLTAQNYTVTVGAGGVGDSSIAGNGGNGANSQFGSLTAAVGGGGGGSFQNDGNNDGANGGSGGGGGGADDGGQIGSGGAASPSGQGNAGGNGTKRSTYHAGGGGGGAGGAGQTSPNADTPGDGGVGATSSFMNAIGSATGFGELVSGNYYFAGGGGGGANNTATKFLRNGGFGGGGAGGFGPTNQSGISGLANTGGGAGGGANDNGKPASFGGSGIVVVRYAK
jgi:hypothetical protein